MIKPFTSPVTNANPTQALTAIMFVNKQLANLLYQKTMPSDVYREIHLANEYMHAILVKLGVNKVDATSVVEIAQFKKPNDVYHALLLCIHRLKEISDLYGIKMLEIKHMEIHGALTPDDVLDLSKIVLSEARYLAVIFFHLPLLEQQFYGYKTPSQVYGQANLFLNRSDQLLQFIRQNPSLLIGYHHAQ